MIFLAIQTNTMIRGDLTIYDRSSNTNQYYDDKEWQFTTLIK